VSLSVLRLQNVFGPGQSPFNPYTGIVILFSQLAMQKKRIELYEDGLITRDFVFIEDVAEALSKSIEHLPKDGFRLLDIGSGVVTTLIELAKMISEYHDAPQAVICGKYRNGDVRHASCDISAAQHNLGWSPKYDLAYGIAALQKYLAQDSKVSIKA
jgi:dTDP-L-rhamnose 4-epimerase